MVTIRLFLLIFTADMHIILLIGPPAPLRFCVKCPSGGHFYIRGYYYGSKKAYNI